MVEHKVKLSTKEEIEEDKKINHLNIDLGKTWKENGFGLLSIA